MPTERGDIVRVWEYDRVNHTVWSVDMLFEGDTLWAHPRITNPSPTQDLNGYWWTNVGQKITVAGTERVVMPAKYDYAGVPWCVTCLLSPSILAAVTQANWRAMHSVRSITGRQATTSFDDERGTVFSSSPQLFVSYHILHQNHQFPRLHLSSFFLVSSAQLT